MASGFDRRAPAAERRTVEGGRWKVGGGGMWKVDGRR